MGNFTLHAGFEFTPQELDEDFHEAMDQPYKDYLSRNHITPEEGSKQEEPTC